MFKRNLTMLFLLALAILLSACGPSTLSIEQQPQPRTLTVSGTGLVELIPDVAYIYIGVHTEDASIAEAVAANNDKAQAVMTAIQRFEVEEKDVRTSNFSIYPQQQYDKEGQLTGTVHVVDNTVYVTVRDLEKLGSLLEAGINAGANSINGITFDVLDKTQAVAQARDTAVAAARQQAEQLSEAAGVTLGDVQTISYYDNVPTPYTANGGKGGGGVMSVPVSAGQMQLTTTVTIIYELK